MSPQKKLNWLNLSSVVSAMAVMMLHANGCFWDFSATERYWFTANIIENVFYFAVPIFFMISGATLLDFFKRYSLSEYLKKRAEKTLIPYLFWAIFGVFFTALVLEHSTASINVKNIVLALLNGNVPPVYWFFIPLFGVYLSVPVFAAVEKGKRNRVYGFTAACALALNIVLPFVLSFTDGIATPLSVPALSGYLFYVLAGYLLTKNEVPPVWRGVLYAASVLSTVAMIWFGYTLSIRDGAISGAFKGYLNAPAAIQAVGIFVFFRYAGEKILRVRWIDRLVEFLKNYTFVIYLVHWYFLQIFAKFSFVNVYSIWYRLGAPFVILLLVVPLAFLIRKIPFIRKLIP